MARIQKAGANHRKRGKNKTQTKAEALISALGAMTNSQVVAKKQTHRYGEVRVEVIGRRVVVVAGPDVLPMADEESAMTWLDNL